MIINTGENEGILGEYYRLLPSYTYGPNRIELIALKIFVDGADMDDSLKDYVWKVPNMVIYKGLNE